ncbi:hypothetical protein, partial [Delftia tsuruhatensis]|uniref:hypothetical protein n=1 Tax=Delftia tsuruhatensis TaxID=180282 RepID=UPI0031D1B303
FFALGCRKRGNRLNRQNGRLNGTSENGQPKKESADALSFYSCQASSSHPDATSGAVSCGQFR